MAPIRTLNGWAVYRKDDLPEQAQTSVLFADSPPNDWIMDWPELFDSTEFSIEHSVDVGLLVHDWNGHPGGVVVVWNDTTGEVAIRQQLRSRAILIRPRKTVHVRSAQVARRK